MPHPNPCAHCGEGGREVLGVLGNRGAAEGKTISWDFVTCWSGELGKGIGVISEVSGWSHQWRSGGHGDGRQ